MSFDPGASHESLQQPLRRLPKRWERLNGDACQLGAEPRDKLHDWCYLELADLEADEFNEKNPGLWTRGLLIRRNSTDGDLAYFTTWCPPGTAIDTLVSVEGL